MGVSRYVWLVGVRVDDVVVEVTNLVAIAEVLRHHPVACGASHLNSFGQLSGGVPTDRHLVVSDKVSVG